MSDIKSVIKLLCHILNTITKINLKAEHFRLGKFNIKDTNCTEILWQVIHKLACVKALDEEETCAKDIVDCVILSLCDLHYTHAYRLSVDACNRELLFALSWLLANGVLAKHLNYHIYKSSLPLYCEFTQSQKIEGILKDNVLKRPKFKSYEDEVNYILLVAGKIKQNVKAISNFSMERASICSAIHRDTAGMHGLSHLSVSEVNLIKNPNLLNTVVNEIQESQQLIMSYIKWSRKSHVFWEWMLSVLREREKCDNTSQSGDGYEKLNEYLVRMKEGLKKKVLAESKENAEGLEDKVFNTSRRLILDQRRSNITSVIKSTKSDIKRLRSLYTSKQEELDKCLLLLRDEMPENTLILQRKINNST